MSLIEILLLPNFGHMITSTLQFELRDKILLVTSLTKIMTPQPIFPNAFILRRPSTGDIIKIAAVFIIKNL